MILQKMVDRTYWIGYADVIEYEKLDDFISRVSMEANIIDSDPNFEMVNVSYPNDKVAVINYRQLEDVSKYTIKSLKLTRGYFKVKHKHSVVYSRTPQDLKVLDSMDVFIQKVTEKANSLDTLSVSFINSDTAIIFYREWEK